MVRINLISPKYLTDQHLIAEYNEILMLLGYVKKFPKVSNIPTKYCLGKGHILFFKNKLRYLKNRHELIKEEMKKRGFKPNKTINIKLFSKNLHQHWKPKKEDFKLIKTRLIEKIKLKPNFYKYYSVKKDQNYLINLINNKLNETN